MSNEESTKTTYAYTPGLKVKEDLVVRKRRVLSVPGEVLVKLGEVVNYNTVIAKAMVAGPPQIIKAAGFLGVDPDEVNDYMVKKEGDNVKKDEVIAKISGFFGFFSRAINSPVDGRIETISDITGQVIIREPDTLVNLEAYIPGKIVEIIPNEGVEIETNATFIQGIFGVGGEVHGELKVCVKSKDEELTPNDIDSSCQGKIIVGGSRISPEAVKKAIEVGANGIIAGGMNDQDLMLLLGYEIGVAITGQEDIPLSLIITEGFGKISMSERSFSLLKLNEGNLVSATGETQIRAGVMRPEIIIPHTQTRKEDEDSEELVGGMSTGTLVRVIREPYFGSIGKIHTLPVELQAIDSESRVRVMEVRLEDGRKVTVPRANVEIIEE